MKSICPLCGGSVDLVPYIDLDTPGKRKNLLLHGEQSACLVSGEAPPR